MVLSLACLNTLSHFTIHIHSRNYAHSWSVLFNYTFLFMDHNISSDIYSIATLEKSTKPSVSATRSYLTFYRITMPSQTIHTQKQYSKCLQWMYFIDLQLFTFHQNQFQENLSVHTIIYQNPIFEIERVQKHVTTYR